MEQLVQRQISRYSGATILIIKVTDGASSQYVIRCIDHEQSTISNAKTISITIASRPQDWCSGCAAAAAEKKKKKQKDETKYRNRPHKK